jgi:DNA-binding PadR family transcriptional regulator
LLPMTLITMYGREKRSDDYPGPEDRGYNRVESPHHHGRRPHRRGAWVGVLFLRLLDEKPMHGYELMDVLNKRGLAPPDKIEPGAIYITLRRMEHRGLLTSRWEEKESGPDRRIYTLTEEGRRVLKTGLEAVKLQKVVLEDLTNYYETHFKQ